MRFTILSITVLISLLTFGQQEILKSNYKFKNIDSLNFIESSIKVDLIISDNLKKVKNRKLVYKRFYVSNDSSAFILDSAWLEIKAYNTKDSILYVSRRVKGRIFNYKTGVSIKFKNVPLINTLNHKIDSVSYLLYMEGVTSFYSDNQFFGDDLFDNCTSELFYGKIDELKRIAILQYSETSGFFITSSQ